MNSDKEMTNTDKVRRVAEWCGWEENHRDPDYDWRHPRGYSNSLPGYLNSRDACAEFERVAGERGLLRKYIGVLWHAATEDTELKYSSNPGDHVEAIWMTTPAQRLDAILVVIEETQE